MLHAGDVGGRAVLKELETIAALRAVYGNVDVPGDPYLEPAVHLEVEGRTIHVSHGHELGHPTPAGLIRRYPEATILVFGHTHRALVDRADGKLVVNPGAAGPRRFDVMPSVARLSLAPGAADVEIIEID